MTCRACYKKGLYSCPGKFLCKKTIMHRAIKAAMPYPKLPFPHEKLNLEYMMFAGSIERHNFRKEATDV